MDLRWSGALGAKAGRGRLSAGAAGGVAFPTCAGTALPIGRYQALLKGGDAFFGVASFVKDGWKVEVQALSLSRKFGQAVTAG